MFLSIRPLIQNNIGFPRVSGDVSDLKHQETLAQKFSPRERGCFLDTSFVLRAIEVFPA